MSLMAFKICKKIFLRYWKDEDCEICMGWRKYDIVCCPFLFSDEPFIVLTVWIFDKRKGKDKQHGRVQGSSCAFLRVQTSRHPLLGIWKINTALSTFEVLCSFLKNFFLFAIDSAFCFIFNWEGRGERERGRERQLQISITRPETHSLGWVVGMECWGHTVCVIFPGITNTVCVCVWICVQVLN